MEQIKVTGFSNPPVEESSGSVYQGSTLIGDTYNKVVTKQISRNSTEEISPEVVYMTIPREWVCTYHQLINYMADAGKAIIDDCSFACEGDGKKLFNCWGLFNSACAAYQQLDYTKAEFFHNYVKQQLEEYYKNLGKEIYNGGNYYPITPDGKLKALCSCSGGNIRFTVDIDTGRLYQEYLDNQDDDEVFTVQDDGHLNVQSDNKV